ncbi:LOW QUALITY PROTEIN: hypothetical protein M8C21_033050, partial [Ambrosia artemisiifolia]
VIKVCKVEIEEKCGVIGDAVNGNVGECVGGDRKEDSDDSSYVFVSGGVEVSGGGDVDDAGGGNVDDFESKSDSGEGVDRLRKEGFGVENGGLCVDPLALESNVDDVNLENGSSVDPPVVGNGHVDKILVEDEAVVKSVDEAEDANEMDGVGVGSGVGIETEGTTDMIKSCPVMVAESDSVIHPSDVMVDESLSTPDVINTPDVAVSNADCEVMVDNGPKSISISNLIDKTDDGSGNPSDGSESSVSPTEEREGQVTVDETGKRSEDLDRQVSADRLESSVSPTEEQEGQVTVDESGKPSEGLEGQVMVDGSESSVTPTDEQEGQVTVDESGKLSEDLECQVSANGSESCASPAEEQEGQRTVAESGKPSEAFVSQVTLDEPESFESSNKELECEMSVDGSDCIGNLVESEPSGDHTEEVDGKLEGQEVLVITSDINVEAEPNDVCDGLKAEHESVSVSVPCQSESKNAEGTENGLSPESEENQDSGLVLSEDTDALANGQAETFDGSLEMGETLISETEADRSVPLMLNVKKEESDEMVEQQTEGSSDTLLEVAESVENEVHSEDKEPVVVEDEVRESQIVSTDIVEDDLNLENNTTESANEVDVPLETETNNESVIHVNTDSQCEVSNSIDKPQEGFQPDGTSENIETVDLVISERNNSELLVVKDNDSLSTHDESRVVDHVKVEDEIQESQIGATDIVEDNTAESANEAEVPLETETNIKSMSHACTASQEGFQPEGSSENIKTVDLVMSECNNSELIAVKDDNSLSTPDELVVVEQKAEIVGNLGKDCGSGIENVDVSGDDEKETEVKDAPVEYVPHAVTKNRAAEGMDGETGVENVDVSDNEENVAEVKNASVESVPVIESISAEGTDCGTGVKNIDLPNAEENETEVKDVPVGGPSTLSFSDTIVNSGAVIEFGSIGRHETAHNIHNEEAEDLDGIQSDEVRTSSVEGSVDAIDVQNEEAEVLPYNFLIRIPRCEDESLREQIRRAQLLVEEKTRLRDAIRVEIQGKRAKLKAHNEAYNAAKTEETAARRLVRLKRQEIDSVQVVINRLKNAMSVEDIDARTLRKELETLKDKASKAEAVVRTVGKTYNEESRMERELQARFRAADDVRQNVYAQLNSLKKLSYDKNKSFRQFKDDLTAARDFASHGNKDALHRLCANQYTFVETFMEQWNNNDEFRKEYISRCSMNASRRQRALDGGPLVPDDVAPVLTGNMNEKADNGLVSTPDDVKSVPVVLPVEEGKIVSSTEKHTDSNSNNRSIENVSGQKNQTLKAKGIAKPTGSRSDDVAVVTELAVDNKKEEENAPTKEEIELAKKAEELRKEEIAAKATPSGGKSQGN